MRNIVPISIIVIVGFTGFFLYRLNNQFDIPSGETRPLTDTTSTDTRAPEINEITTKTLTTLSMPESTRKIFETDNVKHSIPLAEILSGGPPKDGIPSIDNPKFIDTSEADGFLNDTSVGLGIVIGTEERFYPYQILVWHEIVNDTIAGTPVLVTYCPLCATGIVFERRVGDTTPTFGVSGKLWKSNLLMYDRADDPKTESLWSQVLGEAVLGPQTGKRLAIVPADTMLYGTWKKNHPQTKILSRDTGIARSYGQDPYGDYYSDETVSFGATFTDTRLHPKIFVLGIEIDGRYKAYEKEKIPEGSTADTFAGKKITVEKKPTGEVRMSADGEPIPLVGGFWFSWLAVHPDTELYK